MPRAKRTNPPAEAELVIITGLSGSGKATVLRAFEDLGYYAVDNLPVDLMSTFADLARQAPDTARAALGVDIREGKGLDRLPDLVRDLQSRHRVRLVYLEAEDAVLQRRFSETRRPHPLGRQPVSKAIAAERRRLKPIREMSDTVIDTSRLTVHQLRRHIGDNFGARSASSPLTVSVVSFGYRNGLPHDADLVFDVRFLPNPNYVPDLRGKTGKDPEVARYVRSFPQTEEFLTKVLPVLEYLIPHYEQEGKAYLTIAFGCTGGHHRSVMICEEVGKRLRSAGRTVRASHRDIAKPY